MSNKMIRRILEGQRVVEDSELQMYATEPPGAMGEGDDWEPPEGEMPGGWAHPKPETPEQYDAVIKRLEWQLARDEKKGSPSAAMTREGLEMYRRERAEKFGEAESCGAKHEMEFTIDEDGPFNEDEWMSLDEMDLTCEACAGKMRARKMTRIKRGEAQECIAKFGKKSDEE